MMRRKSFREVFEAHEGKVSDKWDLYLQTYSWLFAPLRNKAVRLLEIGIQNGGSLDIWATYFASGRRFVGVDIDTACASLEFPDPRITTIIGDAKSPATRGLITDVVPHFDVIIDDGSHVSSDVIATFLSLLPLLEDDGLYVVEDTHCSYWKERGGELFAPYSAMAFFKAMTDVLNQEHWSLDKPASALLQPFADHVGIELPMADLTRVESITFLNSLIIVRKSARYPATLGKRKIAGTVDDIAKYADVPTAKLARKPSLDEAGDYFWAWHDRPPIAELADALADVARLTGAQDAAEARHLDLAQQLAALRARHATALAALAEEKTLLKTVGDELARHVTMLGDRQAALEAQLEDAARCPPALTQPVPDRSHRCLKCFGPRTGE